MKSDTPFPNNFFRCTTSSVASSGLPLFVLPGLFSIDVTFSRDPLHGTIPTINNGSMLQWSNSFISSLPCKLLLLLQQPSTFYNSSGKSQFGSPYFPSTVIHNLSCANSMLEFFYQPDSIKIKTGWSTTVTNLMVNFSIQIPIIALIIAKLRIILIIHSL